MGEVNVNQRALGDRSEVKKKIKELADLFADTKDAKDRLKAVRVSFAQIL